MKNDKYLILVGVALLGGASFVKAAAKRDPAPETDRIEVIAHLAPSGGSIIHLASGVHWRRNYLYLDQGLAQPVKIIDITDPGAPKAVGELDIPKPESNGDLSTVMGTAALVTSSAPAPKAQTVTILNFADAEHPKVEREFSGVTAMLKDGPFVYLANAQGLWVLQMKPAEDVELDEQYREYVLYNR